MTPGEDPAPSCADRHGHPAGRAPRVTRRGLLRAGGLVGGAAGAVALAGLPDTVTGAGARGPVRPDPTSPRFTLVVMPDTQYLFDDDRGDPRPLEASFGWLLDHAGDENIVFLAHLGDLTQNGFESEFVAAGRSFGRLDRAGVAYSVLAGNHDVDPATDDQRGASHYLETFGPQRFAHRPSFAGASPDGYNSCHVFTAGGRQWLVLALDWHPSAAGVRWAQSVIDAHPHLPVILTTHDLVYADGDPNGVAHLSDFGQGLWDDLIAPNDQIFLTLNGHHWPPGRTVLANHAGHDVHLHIANYQDRYYGGAAMIRLYRFDLARRTIDVETISPWFLGMAPGRRDTLAAVEVELTGATNRFSVPLDVATRFAGFAPPPVRAPRPARDVLPRGTLAYWRFDPGGDGAVPPDVLIRDRSGNRNDLTRVTIGGGPEVLTWSGEHHPDQPAPASLRFAGGLDPDRGAYLRTADHAPLNALTFDRGYTFEAFLKLPADFSDGRGHGQCGVLSRMGTGGDVGKTGADIREPTGVLNLSGGAEPQWAVWPLNQNRISTNWGHYLPLDAWWHLAVVNDGERTVMFVDGCPVARNPSTPAVGIATTGGFWLVGATHYGHRTRQSFYGWLGDVRIVGRPLPVSQFLIA